MNALKLPGSAVGYEKLLTEAEVIDALGLHQRPNPKGALRWLVRTRQIGCVKTGRGIFMFAPEDVQAFIDKNRQTAR